MGAVAWSLPLLASGLLALLRYGFGSLFVVGESLAEALLRSAGADVATTLRDLHGAPVLSALEAAFGLLVSAGAAATMMRQPGWAVPLAALSAGEAWWYGAPLVAGVLVAGAICGIAAIRG